MEKMVIRGLWCNEDETDGIRSATTGDETLVIRSCVCIFKYYVV